MKRSLKAALAAMLALVMALSSLTLGVLAVPEAINEQEIASEAHDPIYFVETGKHLKGADTTPKAIGAGAYYNVDAAVAYARAHALDTPQYPGADCANFTSHCLAAGGITIPNYAYYNSNHPRYDNLGKLNGFTNPYTCSAAQLVYLSEYYPVIKNPSFSQIELGDIVFTNNYDGDPDGHVVIITGFRGNTPLYCGHTNAKLDAPLGSGQAKYAVKMSTYNNLTPPAMPSVSTDASQYCVGSTVTISWNAVSNNQFYWINVYKDGALIIDQSMDNNTSLSVPNIDVGDYWVYLSANNSAGTSGASSCYFSVVDSAPEAPIVTTDSTFYSVGSTVTVSWNAVENNQFYWTNVYRNGELIYDSGLGNNTSFELTNVQAGAYWINLSANNPAGGNGSSCEFVVVDSAPEAPVVTTDSTSYAVGSTVTVLWNAVENNQFYWTNVYRNGEMIYDSSLGNNTSFELTNVQAGVYWINLSANNPAGGNGSSCEFVVVDSAPEAPVVTTDSTSYAVGSTVTVSWNAVENNQFYWTNVYRNGEMIYDSSLGNNTSFELTNVQAGVYWINLSANNPAGGNGSSCEFVVVDSAPEAPVVTTDSTSYAVGSTVTVSWNAVENNQFYWTNVYRNGEMIYDSSLGNNTSFELTNVQAGNYVVLLSANNPMGGNGSSCSFIVNAITPGDIDSNGTVTILDALLALRMGMGMLPVANLEAADMNGDGAVTVIDALMIMRLTMGTA